MQKGDFKGIFREMKGLPVTIRLLDPPLHEFIPHKDEELHALAEKIDVSYERLKRKAETPARVQSHARPSRLPPGRELSRDLPHAGARDHGSGLRARRATRNSRSFPRS